MPRAQRAQDEYTDAYKQSQAHRPDRLRSSLVFADGDRWSTLKHSVVVCNFCLNEPRFPLEHTWMLF